jgi:hypothetical protein
MSVEIVTEAAAQFPEKEYMNGIFIAVYIPTVSRSNFNEKIHIGLLVLILHVATISCAMAIDVSQSSHQQGGVREGGRGGGRGGRVKMKEPDLQMEHQ